MLFKPEAVTTGSYEYSSLVSRMRQPNDSLRGGLPPPSRAGPTWSFRITARRAPPSRAARADPETTDCGETDIAQDDPKLPRLSAEATGGGGASSGG